MEPYPFDDPSENPASQRLRAMVMLDCVAGRADDPEAGPPIAIVTVAHNGEIEPPMMLHLRDVRNLVVRLLAVLAHFDDEVAARVIQEHGKALGEGTNRCHLGGVLASESVWPSPPSLSPSQQPVEPVPRTGLVLTVKFGDRTLAPMQLEVLGAYLWRQEIMFLFRCTQFGEEPVESLAKVVGEQVVRFTDHKTNERLPSDRWAKFLEMPAGRYVRIGQRHWRKLTHAQITALVERKVYRIAPANLSVESSEDGTVEKGEAPMPPSQWDEEADRKRRSRRRRHR